MLIAFRLVGLNYRIGFATVGGNVITLFLKQGSNPDTDSETCIFIRFNDGLIDLVLSRWRDAFAAEICLQGCRLFALLVVVEIVGFGVRYSRERVTLLNSSLL